MDIQCNSYSNSDAESEKIMDFLIGLAKKDPGMLWETVRMNYWRSTLHATRDTEFFMDNARVWYGKDGEVVGLCISEYGSNDMFIEVLPEHDTLYPEMFRWIENEWAGSRPAVEIEVFKENTGKVDLLESRGYRFKEHCENKRVFDLNRTPLDYLLVDNFRIEAFSESSNIESRVALVQSAFDNPRYTEKNLKGLVTSPEHIPEYNLSVVTPDGQHVAYCVGWLDRGVADGGCVEPVGTHADFRKMGLAKAVVRECFRRMRNNGLRKVIIASDAPPDPSNFFYDSLTPTVTREVHKYSLSA